MQGVYEALMGNENVKSELVLLTTRMFTLIGKTYTALANLAIGMAKFCQR